jgi:glycine/D-amino acid oxidase-like deaminating enzyme
LKKWNPIHASQNRPTSIHAKANFSADVAIIGAGIVGIATAYYLRAAKRNQRIVLIDSRQPMSYTSAQSGDNYRNWWPHPTMTAFTNDSIDELERLAHDTNDVFHMTGGGYVLATRRSDIDEFVSNIPGNIAVDVIGGQQQLRSRFPALDESIRNVIHIRRGGDISGQQLGQFMLQECRGENFRRVTGHVTEISDNNKYELQVTTSEGNLVIDADVVVNAAGPFAGRVAKLLGVELPIKNVYQQKIAFEDTAAVIPRDMPFTIDLDPKQLNWSQEERELLCDEPALEWLTRELPGGTHCRPEGGAKGKWVKLGWAYNKTASEPQEDLANEAAVDPQFPEIVIRAAAAFLPALQHYVDSPPTRFSHYGGYYTMTEENWPLIGPLNDHGAFMAGALSGFGSMSACAAGKLCAAYINRDNLPSYAADLSLARLGNHALLQELRSSANKGLL